MVLYAWSVYQTVAVRQRYMKIQGMRPSMKLSIEYWGLGPTMASQMIQVVMVTNVIHPSTNHHKSIERAANWPIISAT